MKHLILGAGNLGRDLYMEIQTVPGASVKIYSLSKGFDVTDLKTVLETVDVECPDVVWYCVGSAAVADHRPGSPLYEKSVQLNLSIPTVLADKLPPNIGLVIFSSDYAADETRPQAYYANSMKPRCEFAEHKIAMEQMLMRRQRPNTSIVRVGSLYGLHKPGNTFPGKILMKYGFNNKKIKLPANIVVPTPTRWLAGILVRSVGEICSPVGTQIEHIAPTGGVTVKDWAKFILRGLRDDSAFDWGRDYFDESRPYLSNLGCSISDERPIHWFDLWNNYFSPEWFVDKEWTDGIPADMKHRRRLNVY